MATAKVLHPPVRNLDPRGRGPRAREWGGAAIRAGVRSAFSWRAGAVSRDWRGAHFRFRARAPASGSWPGRGLSANLGSA
jgi:hypothetical protein